MDIQDGGSFALQEWRSALSFLFFPLFFSCTFFQTGTYFEKVGAFLGGSHSYSSSPAPGGLSSFNYVIHHRQRYRQRYRQRKLSCFFFLKALALKVQIPHAEAGKVV